jgi:hypothetical protein
MSNLLQAQLFGIFDSTFDGDGCIPSGPCAVVPADFVKSWKQWLFFPMDSPRPEVLDNSIFFCEHDMLLFDPNSTLDLDSSMLIVHRRDWETLES